MSLLHAKTLVIDGVWSTVGSTNMDFMSMSTNDEVNAVILNREFAVAMENMFVRDLADSRQIQWEEWKQRPLPLRIRAMVYSSVCPLVVDGPGTFLVVNNWYGLQEYGRLSVLNGPKSYSL